MAQELDPNCGENFAIWAGNVYFQAGNKGLYYVPCDGSAHAKPLDKRAGYLAVPGDGNVYFQAGDDGIYRVPCNGASKAVQLDSRPGHLAVPGDGYVYFQAGTDGLYRVPCNGSSSAKPLYTKAEVGYLAVHGGYVYFQAGNNGLYRVPCAGGAETPLSQDYAGYLVVPGDGYVYFKAESNGLCRVPCDGSAEAQQLDENGGHLAIYDNYVYFEAGTHGLYRVPCDGSAKAHPLDERAGPLVIFGDGYVYFKAGKKGLYRVRCDGKAVADRLDENCDNLIASRGYIYFQGGPGWDSLYRLGVAIPSAPPGLKVEVQDKYEVATIFDPIDDKYSLIKNLLDKAGEDASDTWFINFTSGASTGAYPDAVAGRINGKVATYLRDDENQKPYRLGTLVMDFPDDQGNIDLIKDVYDYNSVSSHGPADWMADVPDGKKISEITIPGTHDSCTFNASRISRCQNMDLPKQLQSGLRFIDIRCRHYKDKFELHHGSEYLGMDFDYVLKKCKEFLKSHPTECIIMSVKSEHDPADNQKTFEEVFMEYVNSDGGIWHIGNNIPVFKCPSYTIRGQIVLLRRFYIAPDSDPTNRGIDLTAWPDNATFTWPL